MTDPDGTNLNDRRAKLDAALAQKPGGQDDEIGRNTASGKAGWGVAAKISSEFIAGVVVGALIGYLIDTFVGTAPWGMIVFLLLGFCAGLLNVLRSIGKVAEPENRMSSPASGKNNNATGNGGRKEQGD